MDKIMFKELLLKMRRSVENLKVIKQIWGIITDLSGDELHEDVLGDDGGLRVGPRTVLLAHPELGQVLPTSHRLQIVIVQN